jgi:hypothetical protein
VTPRRRRHPRQHPAFWPSNPRRQGLEGRDFEIGTLGPIFRAGGGDNSSYGGIELGGRSGQTCALCGEPPFAICQTGSSNRKHAVDLGRGHAADGHSGLNENFGIERVSNRDLVDCDSFSDRLPRSSIEQLYRNGRGADVLLHANSDQAGDDMMDLSEGEPRLADTITSVRLLAVHQLPSSALRMRS